MKTIETGIDVFFQYGILGLFALIMIYVIWYLEKQRTTRELDVNSRIVKLEQKLEDQQKEYDDFIKNEFVKSVAVNEKCMQVLTEVYEFFNKKNS